MGTNVSEANGKDKRYLVTVSYYALSPNDETVIKESLAFVGKLNKEQDCNASVDEICEAPFGKPICKRIL